jgi:hypothetical protein
MTSITEPFEQRAHGQRVKIFAGGSRKIPRLPDDVRRRLDTIIEKQLAIVIGDANGADTAIQQHLADRRYPHVEVFCAGSRCRNNSGGWPVRAVATQSRKHDVRYYSAKDLIMADEAAFGLMIWDGTSLGTLANIFRLLAQRKQAVVYAVPDQTASKLTTMADWNRFMAHRGTQLRHKLEQRLQLLGTAVSLP